MKILITTNDITIGGGVERVVCNLANTFDESGFDVEILSFYHKNDKCPYTLNPNIVLSFFPNTLNVHTKHPLKRLFNKTIYRFFVAYKMKQMFKDKDIILYNCYFFPYFKNKNTRYFKIHHQVFKRSWTYKNKLFDSNIILTSKQLALWQSKIKNVQIIPNFLTQIPNKNADLSQKIVLSIGRMSKGDEKRFTSLIEIWRLIQQDKSFQEWQLHIVGEGEGKQELEQRICKQNLQDSIILKPFTKEIEKEYLNASIYAMTSKYEGFGMVLLEASSYGIPCISFDILTGPSDIIEEGKSGFLVADNDLSAYATKLKLLMHDETLRQTFGKRAKEIAKEKFSKEKIMQQWDALFYNGIVNCDSTKAC